MRNGKYAQPTAKGLVGLATLAALAGAGAWTISRARQRQRADKRRPDMPALAGGRGLRVERTVTIMRPAADLYAEWRDLRRLPEVMPHLESVTPLEHGRSRWVARGPAAVPLTWEADLVADEPGRLIAWRSVEGADVDNAGSVRFRPVPGDRGTELKVLLSYAPPAGRLGGAVATVLGRGGDRQVREDLRRFKQRMEASEVAIGGAWSTTRGPGPAGKH
jgi:uncharacterized membrane protein